MLPETLYQRLYSVLLHTGITHCYLEPWCCFLYALSLYMYYIYKRIEGNALE